MWLVDLGETRQADAWIVADRDKDKETAATMTRPPTSISLSEALFAQNAGITAPWYLVSIKVLTAALFSASASFLMAGLSLLSGRATR
jgi:hypothetical protein